MIPSPNRFPPQIVTCLSLHQPWRERKGREEEEANRVRGFFRNEELEWKNHKKKKQYLGLRTFSTIYLSLFFLSFSLAISRAYPNAIVIDHPACLVHCHIKQLVTAIPGKSKVTKWTCQEALPPVHLSRRPACPLHKLSDNPLTPATPQNETNSWKHTLYQITTDLLTGQHII